MAKIKPAYHAQISPNEVMYMYHELHGSLAKKLIVVSGIYGAGKTTFIQRQLKPLYQQQVDYILPDEKVIEYGYAQGTPEFHHQIIEPMIQSLLTSKSSLLYETTLTSTRDRIELPDDLVGLNDFSDHMPCDLSRMRIAREHGYDEITLYYLSLGTPEKHAEFVHEREAAGSMAIAFPYIVNRFRKSLRNLPSAIQLADHAYLIDNSKKDFRKVCMIEHGRVVYEQAPPQCLQGIISQFYSPEKKQHDQRDSHLF